MTAVGQEPRVILPLRLLGQSSDSSIYWGGRVVNASYSHTHALQQASMTVIRRLHNPQSTRGLRSIDSWLQLPKATLRAFCKSIGKEKDNQMAVN